MGKMFTSLLPEHEEFIRNQRIFFVGSAPLDENGHVNLSPKGYDSFRILSSNEVAYLDLTGSGNETCAHVRENGRITIMFTSFEGKPLILRLYGTGKVVTPEMEEWGELESYFPKLDGTRHIIKSSVYGVQTSCGFGVPYFKYEGERDTLLKWAETKGEEGLIEYRKQKNSVSLDGLPTS